MKVSIMGRITTEHLDDEKFAELWTNATAEGQAVADPHLRECAECRVRFASFTSWLEELRVEAIAEAEQAIPADRLAVQRSQILRRIEAGERPARVIAFPKKTAATRTAVPTHRWFAGVAAACFIAGLGLGQVLDLAHRSPAPPQDSRLVSAPAPGGIVPAVATINEEADLEELEAASMPRYEALRAYDTFTPRAADFIQSAR